MDFPDSTGEPVQLWSPSGAAPVPDVQACLRLWTAQADSADEFALVRALASAAHEPDPELVARALLCQGDPGAALSALGDTSDPLPSADASFRARDLLVAACRAASGDASAHAWLLRSSSLMVDQPRGWFAADLVAVVADLRSEPEVADRAFRLEAERFGINTPHVAGRSVAAHVAERPKEDGLAITRQFAQAATTLEQGIHSIALDPRPTLAATEALVDRGDIAGARLLLEFVTRRNEMKGRLAERLGQLTPASRMRRHGLLVAALIALSPVLLVMGVAAFLVAGVVLYAFRRWVTIPGLSRSESLAWRDARKVRYDPRTGGRTSENPDRGLPALGAIAGGCVGTALGYQIMSALPEASGAVQATAFFAPTSMLAALGWYLTLRWSRERQSKARAASRKQQTEAAVARTGPCRCWETTSLVDDVAAAYADRHLRAAGFADESRRISSVLGRNARILTCPQMGTPWLVATLTDEGAVLAIRGTAPISGTKSTSLGQYL
jgi:membrane protein implicated in regulation of membrane protease activity